MAKAANRAEYCLDWKNEVSAVLYGPVMDAPYDNQDLKNKIRDAVTVLCGLIDEVGDCLVEDGTFSE